MGMSSPEAMEGFSGCSLGSIGVPRLTYREDTTSWAVPSFPTSKSLFPPPIGMSSYPEQEEKKKWKDLKMTKKLERQRAQDEQAKRQHEEEAAAQSEERGEQAGSWAGQRRAEPP